MENTEVDVEKKVGNMEIRMDLKFSKAKHRYKWYFYRKVLFTSCLHVGQSVFTNGPPDFSLKQRERIDVEEKMKILRKRLALSM